MAALKIDSLAPISITAAAAAEIKSILKIKGIPSEYFLRVGTSGGGCSGVSYIIGFDKQGVTDQIYDIQGIQVLIDKKHAMFLWGVEVDYVDSGESGFSFKQTTQA